MTIHEKVARAIANVRTPAHRELRGDDLSHAIAYHGADATAAITAFLEAAAEQEKPWRLVPIEPSPEMRHAAFLAMDNATCRGEPKARAFDCVQGYRAMLAAAPEFEVE